KVKLVDRRGRRLSLTVAGAQIAPMVGRMQRDTEAIERAAVGARGELSGVVAISAPPVLAAAMLAPAIVALGKRHPGLTLRVIGESRRASLDRREADIAVRLSRPTEGDLTVVKLGEMVFRLYASSAYLAATEAAAWRFIGYDKDMETAPHQAALLRFMAGRSFALRASTADMQLAAARGGGGVAMLPDFMAAGVAGLVPAAPNDPAVVQGIWLVVHSDMKTAAPIRAVAQELRRHVTGKIASGPTKVSPLRGKVSGKVKRRRAIA
ncbi:MAG: hypothetical protein B7Y77_01860, partial [Bradyrhizobium sp. 35-63-5]